MILQEAILIPSSQTARHLRGSPSGLLGFQTDDVATTPYAVDIIRGAQAAAAIAAGHQRVGFINLWEDDPQIAPAPPFTVACGDIAKPWKTMASPLMGRWFVIPSRLRKRITDIRAS